MAQPRYTPQAPILPTNSAEPRNRQPITNEFEDGLDEVTTIGMMLPPEAAAVNAQDERRRASLASLSLHKGPASVSAPPQMMTPQGPQTMPVAMAYAGPAGAHHSSKLPWVLLALVLIGGGVYIAKFREPTVVAPPTTAPAVAMPTNTPAHSGGFIASGYIAAKAPIVLASSTNGRLASLKVDNGDRVTKNQIVAILDDSSIRADLSLANAKFRDAQRQLQRQKTALKVEAATLAQVETAQGAVEIAAGEMHVINQKIEDTKIRSPVDGTVLEILARPGETVSASTGVGVMRLADLSQLVAEADISETDLKGIAVDQYAEVSTDSARDKPYVARVKEISTQADRSRGTVLVRAYLEPTAGAVLKPGMAVQVRFLGDQKPTPPATDPATTPPATGSATTPPAAGSAAIAPATPATPATTTTTTAPEKAATTTAPVTETPAPAAKTPSPAAKPPAKTKAKAKYVPRAKAKKRGGSGLDI